MCDVDLNSDLKVLITLVQPEINIYSSKMERSFSSSDLEKCSIASLAQQWMLCSEWVPSELESK